MGGGGGGGNAGSIGRAGPGPVAGFNPFAQGMPQLKKTGRGGGIVSPGSQVAAPKVGLNTCCIFVNESKSPNRLPLNNQPKLKKYEHQSDFNRDLLLINL